MKPLRSARPTRRPLGLLRVLGGLLLVALVVQALALAARHGALQGLHLHLELRLDTHPLPAQAAAAPLPLPSLSWPPGPGERVEAMPAPADFWADDPRPAREAVHDRAHALAHAQGLAEHRHDLLQADWLGADPDPAEDSRSTGPAWHPPQAGPGLPAAAPGQALRRPRPRAEAWVDWQPAPPQRPPRVRA